MMQWVPWGQSMVNFKTHVRTFRRVYPHVIVAEGPGGAGFYMLGSTQPLRFERKAIDSVLSIPGVVEEISSAYDSPKFNRSQWTDAILSLVKLNENDVAPFAGNGPLVTDDRPLPEYFLLKAFREPPAEWLRRSDVHPNMR